MRDWWAFLDWYENLIVYPLAIGALLLLLRAKSLRGRVASGALLVLLFLPHIQKAVGGYYFDYLCRTQAGEFIYRTVDNVEGVLQMRPRDGSKDYFDRMKAGDIPEDPWGHTNLEAQRPWVLFRNYRYFEKPIQGVIEPRFATREDWDPSMFGVPTAEDRIVRFFGYDRSDQKALKREFDKSARSRFGYNWVSESSILNWVFNVYAGETRVVDISDGDLLGKKKGFVKTRPYDLCPADKDDWFIGKFVERVLIPASRHNTATKGSE